MDDAARPRSRHAGAERAASFDAFYKDARGRLLVQTLALTGDLTAARSAVRDAFVVAWHHWRKIARQEQPEHVVRGYAYRFGLRRRSARPFARRHDGDEATRATLEALAGISLAQRKAVILTQLAGVDMAQAAREIGVPVESAERELAAGAALFAHDRGIGTAEIHDTLVGLEGITHPVSWPRATIIRRAGGARRRAHTLIGATAAVVLFAVAGAVVTDSSGLRPTLDRESRTLAAAHEVPPPQVSLPVSGLLTTAELARLGRGWDLDGTTDNSSGNGLVQPCQSDRYADPHGSAALVRRFHSGPAGRGSRGAPTQAVVQSAEASSSVNAAQRAYDHALAWFTACRPPAGADLTKLPLTQLVSTARTPGLGDESALVVLRTARPTATYVVGVARSGRLTTATSLRTGTLPARADRQAVAQVLANAVDRLCTLPGGGACAAARVRVQDAPVFPAGTSSSLLSEIDLPPVGMGHGRLVGTRPRKVTDGDTNVLGCDVVHLARSYDGTAIGSNLTRSFVFVDSDLPKETGLTQVVGSLPDAKAAAYAHQVAGEIAKCPSRNTGMGTHVHPLVDEHGRRFDLTAWRMSTELPGNRSVQYDVALVRSRGAVSQLVYISAPAARLADGDVVDLARRALDRLGRLPQPNG